MSAQSDGTSDDLGPRSGRVRHTIGVVLQAAVLVALVLADVLAFNQLTTQSAIDGIIQLSVVGVGAGGVLLAAALLVLPLPAVERTLAPLVALLAVSTLAGWRGGWPIGWAVLACAISGIVWILLGSRWSARARLVTGRSRTPATIAVLQGVISLWFAMLVAIDARHILFG